MKTTHSALPLLLGLTLARSAYADETVTVTFPATGSEQIFDLPAGVTDLQITAVGARGGNSSREAGEAGETVTADVRVPEGTRTIFVNVGAPGTDGNLVFGLPLGGFNGGGNGGLSNFGSHGGAGGGASDVRTCSRNASDCDTLASRLVVAGGGGGAGAAGPGPGQSGSLTSGGAGGVATMDFVIVDGDAGTFGYGAHAPDSGNIIAAVGAGGGGGGYFGGGSGHEPIARCFRICFPGVESSRGGRGSSFAVASADNVVIAPNNVLAGEHPAPRITISYVVRTPTANAGLDRSTCTGEQVVLDGSASTDSDGGALSYQWTQLAGPSVVLADPSSAITTFVAPANASANDMTLTFQLTVTSTAGQSGAANVNIGVIRQNQAPIADTGAAQSVAELTPVTLDGSLSYDPENQSLAYVWTQIGGTSVELFDAETPRARFYAPILEAGGAYASEALVFALEITDTPSGETCGESLSATHTAIVVVENVDHPPVADAGTDRVALSGRSAMLDGTGSSDPDQDVLAYVWSQVSGPSVVIADANTARPSFVAPVIAVGSETSLVFELAVDDGYGMTATDQVTVRVQNLNAPPDCSLARATVPVIWPPNDRLVEVGVLGVVDEENGQPSITIQSVRQDEPPRTDAVIDARGRLLVRAKRDSSHHANGRVYTVAFTAHDAEGASCTGTVKIAVPNNPHSIAIDDGALYDSTACTH